MVFFSRCASHNFSLQFSHYTFILKFFFSIHVPKHSLHYIFLSFHSIHGTIDINVLGIYLKVSYRIACNIKMHSFDDTIICLCLVLLLFFCCLYLSVDFDCMTAKQKLLFRLTSKVPTYLECASCI